ncbi:hypothetical protein NKH77_34280 [Streptomyces sp. M19]
MTFTNNETSNVQYVYQSFQPTWATSTAYGLTYEFTDCVAGAGATCGAAGSARATPRPSPRAPPAPSP